MNPHAYQALRPPGNDFNVPLVPVGISETHGDIGHHLLAMPPCLFKDPLEDFNGLVNGLVGIPHLEVFGNGKRIPQVVDPGEPAGILGPP